MLNRYFARKRIRIDPANAGFIRSDNQFHQAWSKTDQPTAGAMAYAYDALALYPVNVIGTGMGPRQSITPMSQQPLYYQQPAVMTNGIALTAGTLVLNPLQPENPNGGPVQ